MNATVANADSTLATAAQTGVVDDMLPDTVETDEVAELDGSMHDDGHYIETAAKVNLVWGAHGWELASVTVDGEALDLADDEHERRDNSLCGSYADDRDEECDPHSHRAAVRQVYGLNRLPNAAELLALIGAAVLDAHSGEPSHADLMELFNLALRTPHHELGACVLRTVFQRQLVDAPVARSLTVADGAERLVRMSAGASAAIAARTAPSSVVNSAGVFCNEAINDEIAALFPIEDFWQRANDPASPDVRYDPDVTA